MKENVKKILTKWNIGSWITKYKALEKSDQRRIRTGILSLVVGGYSSFMFINMLRLIHKPVEALLTMRIYVVSMYITYLFVIVAVGYVYHLLDHRTREKNEGKLFSYRGDAFVLAISSGIILNYVSGQGVWSLFNGRLFSFLFGLTAILVFVWFGYWFHLFRKSSNKVNPSCDVNKETRSEQIAHNSESASENYSDGWSERPIASSDEDRLERHAFASHLSEFVKKPRGDSITIGLYGKWGAGKSSVFSMIMKDLETEPAIIHYEFKPWYFGVSNMDVINKFFAQMLEEIRKAGNYRPDLEKELKQYIKLLSTISLRPPGMIVSLKEIADLLMPSDESKSLTTLRKQIEGSINSLGKRIVIIIDDLDRLEPVEMQTIFKLVRLIADFPNVTYILGLDEDHVSKSLNLLFEQQEESLDDVGRRYLDKFIQLPLYLPKEKPSKLAILGSDGLAKVHRSLALPVPRLDKLEEELVDLKFTPRNVKRLILTYEFFLGHLREQVHPLDLLRLLEIKLSSPELFGFIHSNAGVLLDSLQNDKWLTSYKEQFTSIPDYQRYEKLLKRMFPYSVQLFGGTYNEPEGKKLEWAQEKRICSASYFQRYFSYSIGTDEISSAGLDLLLTNMAEGQPHFYESYKNAVELHGYRHLNDEIRYVVQNRPDRYSLSAILLTVSLGYRAKYEENYSNDYKKNYEATIRLVVSKMGEAFFNEKLFFECVNLVLLGDLVGQMATEIQWDGLMPQLTELERKTLDRRMSLEELKKYHLPDSRLLLKKWLELERTADEEVRDRIAGWMTTEDDFEYFLQLEFHFTDFEDINNLNKVLKWFTREQMRRFLFKRLEAGYGDTVTKYRQTEKKRYVFSHIYYMLPKILADRLEGILQTEGDFPKQPDRETIGKLLQTVLLHYPKEELQELFTVLDRMITENNKYERTPAAWEEAYLQARSNTSPEQL